MQIERAKLAVNAEQFERDALFVCCTASLDRANRASVISSNFGHSRTHMRGQPYSRATARVSSRIKRVPASEFVITTMPRPIPAKATA
jgi:hypothetical protein